METAVNDVQEEVMETVRVDFFGVQETVIHYLRDDPTSYVEIKIMTEGDRQRFEREVANEVKLKNGESRINLDPGKERGALIRASIVGWDLYRDGNTWHFSKPNLEKFVKDAPPSLIDEVRTAIVDANPFLTNEDSLDALIELREDIDERITAARTRLEGKDD